MSKVSTRRRNRITLALGAFSLLTFGSLYGLIASNAAAGQSTAAVASVNGTSQTAALVLTDLTTTATKAAPTPAPTAAPAQAATTTHTTSRGS
jgi:zona occludens toxin (predicted ATPase)